jgi:hypothetical protein
MKKLMLCSILSILFFNAYSQDTTCTYFTNKTVHEFNYYTSEILNTSQNEDKYYDIVVKYGDVLCLDFNDKKNRFRKVITEYFDGDVIEQFLDSKNEIYYSPRGVVKVSVGKPKIFKI